MIECRTCAHRTVVRSCEWRLRDLGGVHWCDQIKECDMYQPIDHTESHMATLTRYRTKDERNAYLDRVERAEGPHARQRLSQAFGEWWKARNPDQRRAEAAAASFDLSRERR